MRVKNTWRLGLIYLETQSETYPDMHTWELEADVHNQLLHEVQTRSEELNKMLSAKKPEYAQANCAVRVSLVTLIKDYTLLDADIRDYGRNQMTHVDFLFFHKMDKKPLMAIEVDGSSFHATGSVQVERDTKKNRIFAQLEIPLLRIRTDESNEQHKIEEILKTVL